jgi:hypothetical protein
VLGLGDHIAPGEPSDALTPEPSHRSPGALLPTVSAALRPEASRCHPGLPLLVRLQGRPADLKWMGLQPLSMEEKEESKRELTRRLLSYQEAIDRVTAAILAMPQWEARGRHKPSSERA